MHTPAPRALALRASGVTYPGSVEHIRAVRADLRPLLTDCPMADDMILCASELAANAAIHSNSRLPGGTFTVRVNISPGHYTSIEVEDNGGPWTPPVRNATGHHGLDIVRALADDWGIHGDHTTRTTWATFNWPTTHSHTGAPQAEARCPVLSRIARIRLRIFFTVIKGTPSARRAFRLWPGSGMGAMVTGGNWISGVPAVGG